MEQQVILKSNRYGINLILNENLPFEELLDAIILKFHESDKFFKNASIAITFSGRHLSTEGGDTYHRCHHGTDEYPYYLCVRQ